MKNNRFLILAMIAVVITGISACRNLNRQVMVTKEAFGTFKGKEVFIYTLTNKMGDILRLTNYGAAIAEVDVPDRNGIRENVTFGYDNLNGYERGNPYFGKIIGRFANRISKGRFILDGKEYSLSLNDGLNTLHGGTTGWHSCVWDGQIQSNSDYPVVKFKYFSPDMEEGYPGNVNIEVIYTWTDNDEIVIDYKAITDKKTVINVTSHAYFNLHGAGNGDILDHQLIIKASAFTPVDSSLIPTGEIRSVNGTPFDFRTPHLIGQRIDCIDEQLLIGKGYNHNYVLDNCEEVDAIVYDPSTGRKLEVITDQPCIQFFTGNSLDGTQKGRGGKTYQYRSGFCLETQHYPDSPNQAKFPPVVLTPDKPFHSSTTYRFSINK